MLKVNEERVSMNIYDFAAKGKTQSIKHNGSRHCSAYHGHPERKNPGSRRKF